MARYSSSPEVSRLTAEATEELSENPFFEAELSNPLEAIEHYCRSHLAFQRLAYSQGIAAAASTARYHDCVEVLLPLVEHLAKDQEPEIRSVAVQQICGVGAALHRKDADRSLQDIEATLLVCAQQCALDDEEEVSMAAILAFQELSQLLPAARATAASKRAADRLEARGTDDGTVAAVRLLAHTVSCWTQVALQRHLPRYVNRWANHRDFAVREAVATCMSLFVKAMPLALCHQLLLPFFYQLCRDSNWRVRRACSLDLPRLAQALREQQQQQQQLASDGLSSSSNSSSSSSITAQPLNGSCCQKVSSCLRTIHMSSELGSLSSSNLLAKGGYTRNRSSSALNVPARSTKEIMTKHPMHSSLITDDLLHTSDGQSSLATPSSSQPQPTLLSGSDGEQAPPQSQQLQSSPASLQQQQQQQQGQEEEEAAEMSSCPLQRASPLLHDCWCALRQCMELLSADSSHWVKVAAMAGLGPFMLLLPDCQVGQMLLGRFTSMASSSVVIYEISVALSCAQHFGALAVRLGPQRWPDMREAWQALQLSRDPAALCELVKCLPGLISALGPAVAVQDLLPALAGLLQAHLAWVSGTLVAVMAELLELVPPSSQDMLLKVLEQLVSPGSERGRSWRLRRGLALQLGRMAAAAGPDAVTDSLWPAAMHLCCDPVAAVRSAAAGQVGPLLAALPASLLSQRPADSAQGDGRGRSGSWNGSSSSRLSRSRSSSRHSCCRSGSEPELLCDVDALHCNGEAACCNNNNSGSSSSRKVCSPGVQPEGSTEDATAADEDSDSSSSSSSADGCSMPSAGAASTAQQRGSPAAAAALGAGKSDEVVNCAVRFQAFAGDLSGAGASGYAARSTPSSGRSSLELELDLPSALAPAAVPTSAAAPVRPPAAAAAASLLPIPASYSSHPALGRVISSSLGNGSTSLLGGNSGGSTSSGGSDSSSSSSGGGGDSEEEEHLAGSTAAGAQEQQQQQAGQAAAQAEHQLAQHSEHQIVQQQLERQPEQLHQQETGQQGQLLPGSQSLDVYAAAHTALPPSAAQQQQQQSSVAVHPAMAPIGHPAMSRSMASPPVPAALNKLRRASPLVPRGALPAAAKAKSAGDLLKLEAAAAARHAMKRCHSSASMPGRQAQPPPPTASSSSLGSCHDCDANPSLPDPRSAAPHQYVTCLLTFFGCSRQHQQRQLFVPLVMGTLAACHDRLSCEQAGQLLDRLEALAADDVPGVRYAVAAALHSLRAQAAAQQQQALAPCQQHSSQALLQQQVAAAAAAGDAASASGAEAAAQDGSDSYQRYVAQLATRSGSSVGGPSAEVADAGHGTAAAAADDAGAGDGEEVQNEQGDSKGAAAAASAGSKVQGVAAQHAPGVAAFSEEQQQQPRGCCGVCAAAGSEHASSLEWLLKLSCRQQLERLMGAAALTAGPV